MDHKQYTFPPDPYLTNFWIGSNRTFWASYRFEEHVKLRTVDPQEIRSAHKIPNSDKQTNVMSVMSLQAEIVPRNARQLVIGEKSLE